MSSSPRPTGRGPGLIGRISRFALVGASGLIVNSAALTVLGAVVGVHYVLATVAATQASTLWNFWLSERVVFAADEYRLGPFGRLLRFAAVNNAFLLVRGPVIVVLTEGLGVHYVASNLLTLLATFVIRYAVADRVIWRSGPAPAPATALAVPEGLIVTGAGDPLEVLRRVPLPQLGFRRVDTWSEPVGSTVSVTPAVGTGTTTFRRVTSSCAAQARPLVTAIDRITTSPWAAPVTATALVVATLGLRLWGIGGVGYNSDEAVYAGQGATMLGDPVLSEHFSLFRAHPLLLQLVVGLSFQLFGTIDVVGRVVVAVLFGAGSVAVSYLLAARLYGRAVGVIVALVVATLPYHVIVSRQVMVDTPMGFFVVGAMWLLARYVTIGSGASLLGAFLMLGGAVISKEIAVLAVIPLAITLLSHQGWSCLRERACWLGGISLLALIAPFPLTRLINQPENAGEFILWQIFRDPNHPPEYFFRVLLQFAGPPFLVLLAIGLWVMARRRSTADLVVLPWLGMFLLFFNIWPTKLFPYLFPILPAMAIAVAIGLVRVVSWTAERWDGVRDRQREAFLGAGCVLGLSLALASGSTIGAGPAAQVPGLVHFDIEVQTFAGGREVGAWTAARTPPNARLLTIGPSIGNIVRFYGDRDSVALSVSTDARKRNPAYVPVSNPDRAIRNMDVQYALWDAYSADRSAFYNARLMRYVRKYNGVPVFAVYIDHGNRLRTVEGPAPDDVDDVRLVVYDLQGGNPHEGTGQDGDGS